MRFTKPLTLATLLATSLATLASGCVENKSSVFIYQVQALIGDCEGVWAPDEPAINSGYLDPAFGSAFTAPLLIANQLTPLGNANSLRSETSFFTIKGIEVYVLSGDMASELTGYTAVASGTVPPTTSAEPGFSGVMTQILPPGLDLEPGRTYVSSIRVFGETTAGIELETSEFLFPIQVLPYGSFVEGLFPTGCDRNYVPEEGLACFPGQGPTNCRFCVNPNCQP